MQRKFNSTVQERTSFKINNNRKSIKIFFNGAKVVNNNKICTFVYPVYTFSSARNIIVYTPSRGTNREKHFNHIIYKRKMPTLEGNKHPSIHFLFHRPRLFHNSTENYGPNPSKMDIKALFPRADTVNKSIIKKIKGFSLRGKYYNFHQNLKKLKL